MKKVLLLSLLLSGCHGTAPPISNYLACSGFSGISEGQSDTALMSKIITKNQGKESGSINLDKDRVIVDGIPYMAATYYVCESSDQLLWFASSAYPHCAELDTYHDLGVLNKVTGEVRYHEGDVLYTLSCKKASKLVQ